MHSTGGGLERFNGEVPLVQSPTIVGGPELGPKAHPSSGSAKRIWLTPWSAELAGA